MYKCTNHHFSSFKLFRTRVPICFMGRGVYNKLSSGTQSQNRLNNTLKHAFCNIHPSTKMYFVVNNRRERSSKRYLINRIFQHLLKLDQSLQYDWSDRDGMYIVKCLLLMHTHKVVIIWIYDNLQAFQIDQHNLKWINKWVMKTK